MSPKFKKFPLIPKNFSTSTTINQQKGIKIPEGKNKNNVLKKHDQLWNFTKLYYKKILREFVKTGTSSTWIEVDYLFTQMILIVLFFPYSVSESQDDIKSISRKNRSSSSVRQILKKLKLDSYNHLFVEHEIDLEAFKLLSDADLLEMGIQSLKIRQKILRSIKHYHWKKPWEIVQKTPSTSYINGNVEKYGVGIIEKIFSFPVCCFIF